MELPNSSSSAPSSTPSSNMPYWRVDTEWIIQGVRDRTDTTEHGGVAPTLVQRLGSKWWENENKTLMKVHTVYGDYNLLKVETSGQLLKVIDKRTGTLLDSIVCGRNETL